MKNGTAVFTDTDLDNLFGFEAPAPTAKEDAAPAARLATIDTVEALRGLREECAKEGRPPWNVTTGLISFRGISARGYGLISFPATEALAFVTALDALASGKGITREFTLASLTTPPANPAMVDLLCEAEPYASDKGEVIGLKIASPNWEGSSKPKGTLISVRELGAVVWFIAASAAKSGLVPADRDGLLALAGKYHGTFGAAIMKK